MSDATDETWRPIPGCGGDYEVSDLGRVRSHKPHHGTSQRILRPVHGGQYLQVRLSQNGKGPTRRVHQLVMLVFVGPCPPGQEVRHGPGGKLDNRLVNLCYGTREENLADRVRDGGQMRRPLYGEANGRARLDTAAASMIRWRVSAGESQVTVARSLGVGKSTVGRVVRGECWNDGLVAP